MPDAALTLAPLPASTRLTQFKKECPSAGHNALLPPRKHGGAQTPHLPVDCVARILARCHPADICRLSAVSTTWAQAGAAELTWSPTLPRSCLMSLPAHFDGVPASSHPRHMYSIIQRGLYSKDGTHFLTASPDTGKLCLHVSLAHVMRAAPPSAPDSPLLFRRVSGVRGAVFDPCGVLVTTSDMQLECTINPGFALPAGEYKLGWRVGSVACQGAPDSARRFRARDASPSAPLAATVTQGAKSHTRLVELETAQWQKDRVAIPACWTGARHAAGITLQGKSQGASAWGIVPGCPFHDPDASSPTTTLARRTPVPAQHGPATPTGSDARAGSSSDSARQARTPPVAVAGRPPHAAPADSNRDDRDWGSDAPAFLNPSEAQGSRGAGLGQLLATAATGQVSAFWSQAGRQVARVMSLGKCTCHQVAQIQEQRRDILRRMADLEEMEWERIPLGHVHVAPIRDGDRQAGTVHPGGVLGSGLVAAKLCIEQNVEYRAQSRLHVDSLVLAHQ